MIKLIPSLFVHEHCGLPGFSLGFLTCLLFLSNMTYKNTLLKAFDPETIARLGLKAIAFKTGQKIEAPGEAIRYLYFLDHGMASMTTTFMDGSEVEVGMFGYESVIGISALMGTIQSLNHVYTQIEGTGYRCTLERAQKEFARDEIFHKLCLRYVQAQLVQCIQSAGCAARHNFEQRLSRWLLISADRAHTETFKMSHEFLSHMLGSTRPTVSLVAGTLKKEKLITYARGQIRILNRKGLEKRACECYCVIRDYLNNYEALDSVNLA
jgi:CRP-like cAMP-binding protein